MNNLPMVVLACLASVLATGCSGPSAAQGHDRDAAAAGGDSGAASDAAGVARGDAAGPGADAEVAGLDAAAIVPADAAEPTGPDAGAPDSGPPTCRRIVPTSQALEWGDCYTNDWPVYTGGMERVLATWYTGLGACAAGWTEISDSGLYSSLPMAWIYADRSQPDYNQRALRSAGYLDPPRTNLPPRPWGTKICVLNLANGRTVLTELVDSGPADSRRTELVGVYGAQTWIDLSPGASKALTGGAADNLVVTFWEGPCE
ncbi:MAG TPA: hypothetical protein VGK67_06605 [Myxococcales bacterium]